MVLFKKKKPDVVANSLPPTQVSQTSLPSQASILAPQHGRPIAGSPPPMHPEWIASPPGMLPHSTLSPGQQVSGWTQSAGYQQPTYPQRTQPTNQPPGLAGPSSYSFPGPAPMFALNVQDGGSDPQLLDMVASRFETIISCIDEDAYNGDERQLLIDPHVSGSRHVEPAVVDRSLATDAAAAVSNSNHFSKVWLYANSRLPPHLPPLKLYMSTYPLICLAAKYAERVYNKSAGPERSSFINADFRRGTKAMVLKSVPIDDMNTIVFAIRGSQSIMDWCINYRTAPTSPEGFLDDAGNHCHAGFLGVARKTAALIAERLRTLMQENPGRCTASLLICGHSAGGAVAQLLYAHMLSQSTGVQSELKHLTGFFKRVHCVTFGAPPVSLLPLQKPACKDARKSLFFAFANEGDPVVRADKAVVASLLRLYAASPPETTIAAAKPGQSPPPVWKIPPGALSLAGTIVLLRERYNASNADEVDAFKVGDDQMRTVVFGDPVKHMMQLYKRRVEVLATRAVTAQGFG